MKFTLFKTEFEISFIFTAVLALMIAFDKTGELYLFFVAAALHETAHLIMMCIFNARPKAIRLIPGGINIVDNSPKQMSAELIILLSGPMINLICFFVFDNTFSLINLLLFVYNILPLDGLDGGSIVYSVIGRVCSVKTAKSVIFCFTLTASGLLVLLFIFLCVNGIRNYSLIIFSLYLISSLFLKKSC